MKKIWLLSLFIISVFTLRAQTPTWTVVNTPDTHIIFIAANTNPTINGTAISIGDYIGVFYTKSGNLVCGGMERWTGSDIAISAFADDISTPDKDGFANNETFVWKAWRTSDSAEGQATVSYAATDAIISHQGGFASNGISQLNSFVATVTPSGGASSIVAPSNLQGNVLSDTEISLSWTDNSNNETDFVIYTATTLTGIFTEAGTVTANTTAFTLTNLQAQTEYFIRVKAKNATNQSDDGNTINITTLAAGQSLTTDWTAPTITPDTHTIFIPSSINPTVDGISISNSTEIGVFYLYNGTYKLAGLGSWNGANLAITVYGDDVTTTTRDGMVTGEKFVWKIRRNGTEEIDMTPIYSPIDATFTNTDAFSVNGISGLSALTGTSVTVIAPTNLTAQILSSYQVKLKFKDNSNNENGFQILRSVVSGGTFTEIASVADNITEYIDETALAGNNYFYKVLAFKGSKKSETSNEVTVIMPSSVSFSIDNISANCGTLVEVPIKVRDFQGINGVRFTLNWDKNVIDILGTQKGSFLDINDDANFDYQEAINGSFTFFWDNLFGEPASIPNDSTLFKVRFYVLGTTGLNSPITFSTLASSNIVINGKGNSLNFINNNGSIVIASPPQSISIEKINSKLLCANTAVEVEYKTSAKFGTSNFFSLEISDENGSFGTARSLVFWEGNESGKIQTIIPNDIIAGSKYRIRIKATEPCYTSPDNGTDLKLIPSTSTGEIVGITQKNVACFGEKTGSAEVFFNCDIPVLKYEWSNGQTGKKNGSLEAGIYSVKIYLTESDIYTASVTITQPEVLSISAEIKDVTAAGAKNGSINLIVRGGNQEYKYTWLFPDGSKKTTEDLDSLTSGKYEVLVTDSICTVPAKLVVLIKEPDSLSVSRTVKDITCKGGKDGSIESKIYGGVPPYKVFINTLKDTLTVTSTNPTFKFSGLDWNNAEPYEILIKDENNTAITFQVTLKEPAGEIALSYLQSVYCIADANPKATLSGIRNGKFVASPAGLAINAQTGEIDLQKSTAGSYSVSYQTANNACAVKPFAITVFGFPFKNGKKEILTCESAVLDAQNAGMTFKWSTGETTQRITVRKEGTYTVNIFNGTCNILDTVKVLLSQPTVQFKKTDIVCKGEASGVIEVTKLAGGIGSYKIEWADDRTPNLRKRENLKAGTYTLIITDSICRSEQKITIVEPISELIAQAEVKGTTGCFGENNGTVRILASGGTPPYSYQWDYKNAKTSFIDKLGNGIYSVVVTDSAKCSKKLFVLVTQADTMAVKVSVKEATCTNDGGISLEVSGGKAPYSFKWSNGSATATLTNLAPTVNVPYECIITDAQGCVKTVSTHVRRVAVPTATLSGTKSFCLGESAELTVKYKGSMYPYQITYTDGKTPVTVSGIMDSVYKTSVKPTLTSTYKLVSVVYGSNCQAILQGEANITVFNLPEILAVLFSNENCGNKDGKILVSDRDVKSGKAPFEYSIDGKTFAKTDTFGSLKAGAYTLSVRDANGCVYVYPKPIEIRNQECLINTKTIPTVITPNGDGQNDTWEVPNLSNFKDCIITVFDRLGGQVFSSVASNSKAWDGSNDGKELPLGTYYYVIDFRKVGHSPITGFIDIRR